MQTSRSLPVQLPTGLSFEVEDLISVRAWANLHDVIVEIRLDHGMEGEEYEEVITLHTKLTPQRRLIMWRNTAFVFVQPLVGVREKFDSVGGALASLGLKQRIVLSDIVATSWPIDQGFDRHRTNIT